MRKFTKYAIIITILFVVVFMIVHPIVLNTYGQDLSFLAFAIFNAPLLLLMLIVDVIGYRGEKEKITIFFKDLMISVLVLLLYSPIAFVQGFV